MWCGCISPWCTPSLKPHQAPVVIVKPSCDHQKMPFLSTVHIVVPVNNRGIMLRVSISILVRKGAPGQRFIVCHVSVTMAQTNQIDRRTLRDYAISHVLLTVGPELALPALNQLIRAKFPPKGWYLQSRMAEAWVKVSVVFSSSKGLSSTTQ